MRKIAAASAVLVLLALAGCSVNEPAAAPAHSSPASTPTPTLTVEPATSIEDVLAKTDCVEGPSAMAKAPVVRATTCDVDPDAASAYLFELPSASAATQWLDSGALEIGASDAVFVDGAVVILATDAASAQAFAEIGTVYP